jgi:ubiquitin-activating enzyme E1 C
MNVLLIGAGGIGTSILAVIDPKKIGKIAVVDFDSIELSNLNRQYLYNEAQKGKAKVEVIKNWLDDEWGLGVKNQVFFDRIQNLPIDMLSEFNLVFCAVDNLETRLYVNRTVFALNLEMGDKKIVLIDCGSEKLMGHVQIINFGQTACLECAISLFEDNSVTNVNYCHLKKTPLTFEDCIKIVLLSNEKPTFEMEFTGDFGPSSEDFSNIHSQSVSLAICNKIEIQPIWFTENFMKKFSLNLSSTNSMVAAIAWQAAINIVIGKESAKNYITINCENGILVESLELHKRDDCIVCNQVKEIEIKIDKAASIDYFRNLLKEYGSNNFCLFSVDGEILLNSRDLDQGRVSTHLELSKYLCKDFASSQLQKIQIECFFKSHPCKTIFNITFA